MRLYVRVYARACVFICVCASERVPVGLCALAWTLHVCVPTSAYVCLRLPTRVGIIHCINIE